MHIPFSPPEITDSDIEAVTRVLRSGWLTTGKEAKAFEAELSTPWMDGARVAVLNSATAAMELVLRMLGVGAGDEVITSVYTYAATANVIQHVGATPVFVDIEKDGYNMDLDALARAITPRTKVIIPVDIGGYPCDYDALYGLVEAYKGVFRGFPQSRLFSHGDRIVILADAAHSLGAKYHNRMSGNLADFSAFSFHAVKNLTTGEGGALSFRALFNVDVEEIYKEVMLWSLHGQNKDALAKSMGNGWEYDIIFSGYKCNMTDMMAALGRSQLKRYEEILLKRRTIYTFYREELQKSGLKILAWDTNKDFISSFHLVLVELEVEDITERNQFIEQMARDGVVCNVHFKPLVLMQAFQYLGYCLEDFPQAMNRYKRVLSLPIYNSMSDDEMGYVMQQFRKNYKKRA